MHLFWEQIKWDSCIKKQSVWSKLVKADDLATYKPPKVHLVIYSTSDNV